MKGRSGHIEKLGEYWAAAERRGDTGFLARVLADDFIAVGPRGFMLAKEQWLSRHDSGNLVHESFDWDEVRVRAHRGTAVMTARETAEGRYEDGDVGHEIRDRFRATLIFAEERGTWLLLGLHLIPIAGPPGGRSRRRRRPVPLPASSRSTSLRTARPRTGSGGTCTAALTSRSSS